MRRSGRGDEVRESCRVALRKPCRKRAMRTLFTFDTTHHALWAEEVALGAGLACELVPAPPAARARCNLALELMATDMERAAACLREAGVPFRLHASPPPDAAPPAPAS